MRTQYIEIAFVPRKGQNQKCGEMILALAEKLDRVCHEFNHEWNLPADTLQVMEVSKQVVQWELPPEMADADARG